ncbi:hypothetical protein CEXT_377551 [Caerostris extrusa]|uniref:Uncharacterized protein n=1 Tax=Caerostris extrusa TaxID=172846 RepID=A0AAV4WII5_CAEEX|nr:hypothetical protein CEXT_377551 [Caerostris extrusa]
MDRPPTGRAPFLIEAFSGANPNYQKIMHPKQPQFADVANVSPSKCYDGPLLGRSPFLIRDDSSARENSPEIPLQIIGKRKEISENRNNWKELSLKIEIDFKLKSQ